LDKFKEHVTATTFNKYKKKSGAWNLEAWCVKMFKLLEQLQLFDSDTISAKQVWMDIKTMLRKAIDDFQSPIAAEACSPAVFTCTWYSASRLLPEVRGRACAQAASASYLCQLDRPSGRSVSCCQLS
jgi:hypothetical protein